MLLGAALMLSAAAQAQDSPVYSVQAISTFQSYEGMDGDFTLTTSEGNDWRVTLSAEPLCNDSLQLQLTPNGTILSQYFALDHMIAQVKIECGSAENAKVTIFNDDGNPFGSAELLPYQTTTIDIQASETSLMSALLEFSCAVQEQSGQTGGEQTGVDEGYVVIKSITLTYNQWYELFVGDYTNMTQVTDENRANILGGDVANVSFDGVNTLILDNADLSSQIISCALEDGLTIYFTGDNKIGEISGESSTLIFMTDQNKPGKLTLGGEGDAAPSVVINGFNTASLGKGLSVLSPDGAALNEAYYTSEGWEAPESTEDKPVFVTYAEIGPRIQPILNEEAEPGEENPQEEEVTFTTTDIEETTDLSNITINNVVITLDEGDGYDIVEGSADQVAIVLNNPVEENTMDDVVEQVASGALEPGSDDYAAVFTGLTFMVPAGTGNIKLKMEVNEGSALNVRVGKSAPVTFTKSTSEEEEAIVPYVCTEPQYVYIYDATPAAPTARKKVLNRTISRERKTGGHIKLTSFLVDPEGVLEQSKPEAQKVVSALSPEALAFHDGMKDLKVTDASVNSLVDGFFTTVCGAALGNIRSINLTETSITGVEVSRSRGAFEDVPDDAVIYMPAGNVAAEGEANVVIGGVCNNLQMPGNANDSYEGLDMDFSAQAVTFGREFAEDQTSTVFLPFTIDKATAAALGTFYTFDGIGSDGNAKLAEVNTGTEAHTPYIFIKRDNGNLTVNNVKVKGGLPGDYKSAELIGTYEAKTFTDGDLDGKFYYGYAAEDKDDVKAGEFVRIGAGATIKPFRAYLELESDHGARIAIDWGDGSLTGITTMHDSRCTMHNDVYDLQGRRVSAEANASLSTTHTSLQKGIYVRGGKKFIVK